MKASESIKNFKPSLRMYANFAARNIKKICAEIGPREAGTQAELDAQADIHLATVGLNEQLFAVAREWA